MSEEQLRAWLEAPRGQRAFDRDVEQLLAGDVDTIPDVTRRALCFTIALLRDIYSDDREIREWLLQPELIGSETPMEMLRAGRIREVETSLVRRWNQGGRVAPRTRHLAFRSLVTAR